MEERSICNFFYRFLLSMTFLRFTHMFLFLLSLIFSFYVSEDWQTEMKLKNTFEKKGRKRKWHRASEIFNENTGGKILELRLKVPTLCSELFICFGYVWSQLWEDCILNILTCLQIMKCQGERKERQRKKPGESCCHTYIWERYRKQKYKPLSKGRVKTGRGT